VAVSLMPVPSEEERLSCPNCSAALAADQRYCLACGQPVSAVRLAFLDVLQPESQPSVGGQGQVGQLPIGYVPVIEPASGAYGWMRRYSGLFGLLTVLLMSIIVGLLVGHWVTQNKAAGPQVLKVEGLAGATPLASTAPTSTAPTSTAPASTTPHSAAASQASAKAEAKEATEAKAIEKAPPAKPVKLTATKLQKLGNTTGQKHEEEISKLGSQPIETGG
jgi:hypothetical protein